MFGILNILLYSKESSSSGIFLLELHTELFFCYFYLLNFFQFNYSCKDHLKKTSFFLISLSIVSFVFISIILFFKGFEEISKSSLYFKILSLAPIELLIFYFADRSLIYFKIILYFFSLIYLQYPHTSL